MNAGSGQMVYVYFQNPTYPGDFPGTDFLIFRATDMSNTNAFIEFFPLTILARII